MQAGSEEIRVLHVDDDPDFLELTREFLVRADEPIVVDTATGTSAGLARLAETDYDCIVSDLDMPGEDGIDFLETVRETDSDLPFILFTGKGSEEIAATAISAGVSDYLQKGSGTDQYTVLANRITNVYNQYRAEQALESTVNRLDTVVSNFPLVLFALDEAGTFTLSEGKGLDQLGLEPGEVVGDSVFDWYGWHEGISDGIGRALDGETVTDQYVVEGTVFDCAFQPVFDDAGAVSAVIGVAMDVTERTERERALQRERDRFTALYENFPEPTVTFQFVDDEPIIRAVNDAFVETFGFESAEVVGESIDDVLVPPDEWEDARTLNRRVLAGEPVDEEVRRRTADGDRLFWFRNIPIPDSSELDGFAVYADITDLKRRERELERTQTETEQLQDLLEHALVSTDTYVWEWDLETQEVERYPTVEPLFGVTSARIGNVFDGFIERVHPEDRDRVEELIEEGIETGTGYQFECRFETADGSWCWIRDRARVQTADGEPVRAIGSVTDVTEQKEREGRLERQNERLEEFTDIVSHDLRSPLGVASGKLALAEEECESAHLADVRQALDRMSALVDDLLSLARLGETVGTREEVPLAGVARRSWQHVESEAATLTVETDLSLRADPSRLQQLLENLLSNAVTYAGPECEITVGSLEDGFFVSDDGPGITPGERDEIFEGGYTTSQDGTGFGLSIVREIAQAHDWSIEVGAGDDGGARFEFTGVESV
jgi:PAS domain S-box-containing protein